MVQVDLKLVVHPLGSLAPSVAQRIVAEIFAVQRGSVLHCKRGQQSRISKFVEVKVLKSTAT